MAKLYSPLNLALREIRLLSLLPGDFADVIHCQLSVVSLDEDPAYEALSYVWGDARQKLPIILNGENFIITKNLESALRYLRDEHFPRHLWVDAICINQNDIMERAQQVGLMDAIYSKTKEVLIWLGREQEGSDKTFLFGYDQPEDPKDMALERHPRPFCFDGGDAEQEAIEMLEGKVEEHIHKLCQLGFEEMLKYHEGDDIAVETFAFIRMLANDEHPSEMFITGTISCRRPILLMLSRIMHRTWWYRMWVVQETILPPKATLVFGSLMAPWTMFAQAAENFEWHRNRCCKTGFAKMNALDFGILSHFGRTILELETTRKFRAKGPTTLLPLIWLTKSRKATDSRDKIFGLLGLVTDWRGKNPIRADYSTNSKNVFLATTLKMIEVEESLAILAGSLGKRSYPTLPDWAMSLEPSTTTGDYGIDSYRRILEEKHDMGSEDFPSWLPCFDIPPPCIEWDRLRRIQLYNACNDIKPASYIIQDNILSVKGYRADKVHTLGDVLIRSFDSSRSVVTAWQELARERYESDSEPAPPDVKHDHPFPASDINTNPCKLTCPAHSWHAFFRVLCTDSLPADKPVHIGSKDRTGGDQYRRMETEDLRKVFAWWRWRWPMNTSMRKGGRDRGNITDYDPFDAVGSVEDAVWSACIFRRLFITEKGRVGTGPAMVVEGDVIFALEGGSVPFVLRTKNEGQWELVGDCFVWGLMDGQGIGKEPDILQLV
ncbi:hypothetical protein EG329_012414 [Mollisiaceae sp. DMI_Dod_QoI]|nr:hypothetical protein EG329_012414 [Helotiales sp. DMI_Dod_QoI]